MKHKILLSTVGILFAIITSYLPFTSMFRFNTPDETANNFFAQQYALHGTLKTPVAFSDEIGNAIHPRSVNVIRGNFVPQSFLGLPLFYGTLAKVVGDRGSQLLTPILTLLTLPFFYIVFQYFFGKKVAGLALIVVLVNPAFLYFTGRTMMHNILFIDALVAGFAMIILAVREYRPGRGIVFLFLSGLFIGGALAVRGGDAFWVLLLLLGSLVAVRKKITLRNWIVVALGGIIAVLPILIWNVRLYGHIFQTGYGAVEQSGIIASRAVNIIFPFGLAPRSAIMRVFKYGVAPMQWYAAFALFGAVLFFGGQRKRPVVYVIMSVCLAAYLFLLYGSFNAEIYVDPKHPLASTIGTAYVRYWLPIWILGAPFVAAAFIGLVAFLRKRARLVALMVPIFIAVCLRTSLWIGEESMLAVGANVKNMESMGDHIQFKTSKNSVFVVPAYMDRVLFPARAVIVDTVGKDVVAIIKTLMSREASVFYWSGRGAIPLGTKPMPEYGLRLIRRFDLDAKGKLYEITKL